MPADPAAIVDFWIGDADSSPAALRAQAGLWYRSSPDLDADIDRQFGAALRAAEHDELDWHDSAPGQLALVILLDQFSRNLHRRSVNAWRNDPKALAIATRAVARGDHLALGIAGRVMLYHPFHHAESRAAQARSVALFEGLLDGVDAEWQQALQGFVDFAREHHDIVMQFGRFPHRNATLGRASTPEEQTYLDTNKNRYGQ